MRWFQFEDDIHRSLDCVPMAVRRKLDRAGIKIGLAQWQALGRGERLAICHLPTASSEELETLQLFIDEAVARHDGSRASRLPEADRALAEPPAALPAELADRASVAGLRLDQAMWHRLDADERYALIKLAGGKKISHNFPAALREFFPH